MRGNALYSKLHKKLHLKGMWRKNTDLRLSLSALKGSPVYSQGSSFKIKDFESKNQIMELSVSIKESQQQL